MKVLVLGAGGPAGVNTCKALQRAQMEVFAYDANPAHLDWCPAARWTGEDVDVVVPQPDSLVASTANWPEGTYSTFLPRFEVINLCQDKSAALDVWASKGLRSWCYRLKDPYPDYLHLAHDEFGTFWLRANRGAGANKAIKVDRLDTAFHWIRFWETRGEDVEWIAEEYLPGRDLAWTSIWYQGELVACFLRERLEYLYPHLSPEGLTGTPTIAAIRIEPETRAIAMAAVEAIDDRPHGIYSVDLREDSDGVPRPTEINAGRAFTTMGLWSLYDVNFTALAARCALEAPTGRFIDPLPEGLTLSRHIDCPATFTEALVAA